MGDEEPHQIPAHYLENDVHYLIKEDIRACTLLGPLWMLVVQHGNFLAKVVVPPKCPTSKESLVGWVIRKISFPSQDGEYSRPQYGKNYCFEFS